MSQDYKNPAGVPDLFDDRDVLLTTAQAAQYLVKGESTLERWRRQGVGPKTVKTGLRGVAYPLRELRLFTGQGDGPAQGATGQADPPMRRRTPWRPLALHEPDELSEGLR